MKKDLNDKLYPLKLKECADTVSLSEEIKLLDKG